MDHLPLRASPASISTKLRFSRYSFGPVSTSGLPPPPGGMAYFSVPLMFGSQR